MAWKWNRTRYSGELKNYKYPSDVEFGDLLTFLKQVDVNKKIHLTDVIFNRYPLPGYDMYIVCAFGEAVDEDFINRLDADESLPNPVLITSQLYNTTNYKRVKVFHLEHMHTIRRFFQKTEYTKLSNRTTTHSILSRRTALHKTLLTVKLLAKFPTNLNYTFNSWQPGEVFEYTENSIEQGLDLFYPGMQITDLEKAKIKNLHQTPVVIPGDHWGIDNKMYQDSKLVWATESIFFSKQHAPVAYLTEKTIKPIISGSAFVSVAQQLGQQRLDNLGFKSIIELQTDTRTDQERFGELFNLIDNYDFEDLLSRPETQEIVDYNYSYFWGAFYSHIEYRNRDRITEILDYINET